MIKQSIFILVGIYTALGFSSSDAPSTQPDNAVVNGGAEQAWLSPWVSVPDGGLDVVADPDLFAGMGDGANTPGWFGVDVNPGQNGTPLMYQNVQVLGGVVYEVSFWTRIHSLDPDAHQPSITLGWVDGRWDATTPPSPLYETTQLNNSGDLTWHQHTGEMVIPSGAWVGLVVQFSVHNGSSLAGLLVDEVMLVPQRTPLPSYDAPEPAARVAPRVSRMAQPTNTNENRSAPIYYVDPVTGRDGTYATTRSRPIEDMWTTDVFKLNQHDQIRIRFNGGEVRTIEFFAEPAKLVGQKGAPFDARHTRYINIQTSPELPPVLADLGANLNWIYEGPVVNLINDAFRAAGQPEQARQGEPDDTHWDRQGTFPVPIVIESPEYGWGATVTLHRGGTTSTDAAIPIFDLPGGHKVLARDQVFQWWHRPTAAELAAYINAQLTDGMLEVGPYARAIEADGKTFVEIRSPRAGSAGSLEIVSGEAAYKMGFSDRLVVGTDSPHNGSQSQPFRSINWAVGYGAGGAMSLQLAPGTYNKHTEWGFPIRLYRVLNLTGAGAGQTIIDLHGVEQVGRSSLTPLQTCGVYAGDSCHQVSDLVVFQVGAFSMSVKPIPSIISGLTIRNCPGPAIVDNQLGTLEVRECVFENNVVDLSFQNNEGNIVADCEMAGARQASVFINNAAVVLERNRITDSYGYGIYYMDNGTIVPPDYSDEVKILESVIANCQKTAIYGFNAGQMVIENCYVTGNQTGVVLHDAEGVSVRYNTIGRNYESGLRLQTTGWVQPNTRRAAAQCTAAIMNNIFACNECFGVGELTLNSNNEQLIGNLFFNNGAAAYLNDFAEPINTETRLNERIGTESAHIFHNRIGNPQIVDTNLIPTLEEGSAAINQAQDLKELFGIDSPSTDLMSNPRPSGNGYDVGAIEFQSGPPVSPTPTPLPVNPNMTGYRVITEYTAGEPLTIAVTIDYSDPISSLGMIDVLPEGWNYMSKGGQNPPDLARQQGREMQLLWSSIPPGGLSFTYTVAVPPGTTGMYPLSGTITFTVGTGSPEHGVLPDSWLSDSPIPTATATPTNTPMPVNTIVTAHRSVVGDTYTPDEALSVSVTITYTEPLSSLGMIDFLPSGWTQLSFSGAHPPDLVNQDGTQLQLLWSNIPASPVEFVYQVSVAAQTQGLVTLHGQVNFTVGGGTIEYGFYPDLLLQQVGLDTPTPTPSTVVTFVPTDTPAVPTNTPLALTDTPTPDVSMTPTPVHTFIPGDLNRDGVVDSRDLFRFLSDWWGVSDQ